MIIGQSLQRILKYNFNITIQKEVETIMLQTYYNLQYKDKLQYLYNIYKKKNYVITNIKQLQALF